MPLDNSKLAKPSGKLVLDKHNPFYRNLMHAIFDCAHDEVGQAYPVLPDEIEFSGDEFGTFFRKTSDPPSTFVSWPQNRRKMFGSENRTFLIVMRTVLPDQDGARIMSIGDDNTGLRDTLRYDSGNLRFEVSGANYVSSLEPELGFHVIGWRLDGTTIGDVSIWMDGEKEDCTGTLPLNYTPNQWTMLGDPFDSDPGRGTTDCIYGVFAWHEALSDAEIINFSANPWQILKRLGEPEILKSAPLAPEILNYPPGFSSPVTFARNASTYYVVEDGSFFLADFTGGDRYLDPAGDDANTGTAPGAANAWRTIDKALADAPNLSRVNMAPGEYDFPTSTVDVRRAFLAPSGGVFIGEFDDLTGATIGSEPNDIWNVEPGGAPYAGILRTDQLVRGLNGTALAASRAECEDYQARGVLSLQRGGSTSNISTGTTDTLPDLVADGHVKGWRSDATGKFLFGNNAYCYFGPGIIGASYADNVFELRSNSRVVFDGVGMYGAKAAALFTHTSHTGECISFNTRRSGSEDDVADYKGSGDAVESGCVIGWPYNKDNDNASTAHSDVNILRVQSTYYGGSRTIDDIDTVNALVFSNLLEDAIRHDRILLRFRGQQLDYGANTYSWSDPPGTNESFESGIIVNTELTDPWPYGSPPIGGAEISVLISQYRRRR